MGQISQVLFTNKYFPSLHSKHPFSLLLEHFLQLEWHLEHNSAFIYEPSYLHYSHVLFYVKYNQLTHYKHLF